MKLHEPFKIGPNLRPGVLFGGVWMSLLDVVAVHSVSRKIPVRRATLALSFHSGAVHEFHIDSGYAGFKSMVDIFETALAFLIAAHESYPGGENADLFPAWVVENTNADDAAGVQCLLFNEDGAVNRHLIEE